MTAKVSLVNCENYDPGKVYGAVKECLEPLGGMGAFVKPVLEADVIITLPKMKTHGFTLMTGAIKNHLGIIPGPRKAELHRRFPDPEQFGEALLDIYLAATPRHHGCGTGHGGKRTVSG